MKVTIKDVACKANVAISTVSLVLNQKAKVSEETRQKVLAAMRELNYHPSRVARGLAGRLTGNIGFIVSEDHFTRSEPFYTHIFIGSEFEARNHNVYVLLTVVNNEFRGKKDIPRFLIDRIVDGIIIAGRVPYPLINHIQKYNIPTIFIDFLPQAAPAQAVLIDNFEGARQAVTHLINRKRQRIGFIAGDIEHPSIHTRYEGYLQTLREKNLPVIPELANTSKPDATFKYGLAAVDELIAQKIRFDALFAANDALALGCLRRLKEHRLRIPEDVALVGFDDVAAAAQANPPLTTIRVNKEDLGILALKNLMEIIHSQKKTHTKILIPTELIIRKST